MNFMNYFFPPLIENLHSPVIYLNYMITITTITGKQLFAFDDSSATRLGDEVS